MDNSRFSIFEAAKEAYLFLGREWFYLFKAGLLPVAVQTGTALFLHYQRPDVSEIENYLWSFPSTVLFAWFLFVEVRLLLLDERIDYLPDDKEYLGDRLRAMKLSVIIFLLFNMGMTVAMMLLIAAADSGQWGKDLWMTAGGMLAIGGIFWGLRFSIAAILAAVDYPIRPVLKQVQGAMFSLRLVSLGLVCLFPVAILFQLFISAFIQATPDLTGELKLAESQEIAILVASAPLSLLVSILLNASVAYALKQLLGGRQGGVVA